MVGLISQFDEQSHVDSWSIVYTQVALVWKLWVFLSKFGSQRAANGAADRSSWTQALPAHSKMCGLLENEDLKSEDLSQHTVDVDLSANTKHQRKDSESKLRTNSDHRLNLYTSMWKTHCIDHFPNGSFCVAVGQRKDLWTECLQPRPASISPPPATLRAQHSRGSAPCSLGCGRCYTSTGNGKSIMCKYIDT